MHRQKKRQKDNYLQNTTQKTNGPVTRTPLNTGGELGWPGGVNSSCSTSDTCRVAVKEHEYHLTWKSFWTPVYENKYKKPPFSMNIHRLGLDLCLAIGFFLFFFVCFLNLFIYKIFLGTIIFCEKFQKFVKAVYCVHIFLCFDQITATEVRTLLQIRVKRTNREI